jgi:nitrogenase molybdenum-iron protein NifN
MVALHEISGEPVPESMERQRAQLQDAMLDCHFMLGMARFAVAGDPDLLHAFTDLLQGVGAQTVAAVSPINAPVLRSAHVETVKIGDLADLEKLAADNGAEVLVTNSHGVESAARLGIPLLRAGFPQYDLLGGYQKTWIGYRGTRQVLFDMANIMLGLEKGEIHPYRSIFAQKPEYREEAKTHDVTTATAAGSRQH